MNKSKKYIESYNQIDELHYKNFYVKEPIFCEMINENEYKAYDGKREFIVSKKEKKKLSEYKRILTVHVITININFVIFIRCNQCASTMINKIIFFQIINKFNLIKGFFT